MSETKQQIPSLDYAYEQAVPPFEAFLNRLSSEADELLMEYQNSLFNGARSLFARKDKKDKINDAMWKWAQKDETLEKSVYLRSLLWTHDLLQDMTSRKDDARIPHAMPVLGDRRYWEPVDQKITELLFQAEDAWFQQHGIEMAELHDVDVKVIERANGIRERRFGIIALDGYEVQKSLLTTGSGETISSDYIVGSHSFFSQD